MVYNPYLQAAQGQIPPAEGQLNLQTTTPDVYQQAQQAVEENVYRSRINPMNNRIAETDAYNQQNGMSVPERIIQNQAIRQNPTQLTAQERNSTRAMEASQRLKARLGDESARQAELEDARRITQGEDPNKVRAERAQLTKFQTEASDKERIANHQLLANNPQQAHKDLELERDILYTPVEAVTDKYNSRPELLNYILQQKQQYNQSVIDSSVSNRDSSDTAFSLGNFGSAIVAGLGENVGGIADTITMATTSGADRVEAMNNGLGKSIQEYADSMQTAGGKASDARAKADIEKENRVAREAYLTAKEANDSDEEASNKAEWAKTKQATEHLIDNPYQITKEAVQFVPDLMASIFAGGAIAKGAQYTGRKVIEKSAQKFEQEMAQKVRQEALEKAAKEGLKDKVADEFADKAVSDAKKTFMDSVQKEVNSSITLKTRAGVAGYELGSNIAQNAPQGYQTASQVIMNTPISTLKNTDGFKELQKENPDKSDEEIQALLADKAGVKGYGMAAAITGASSLFGSQVEAAMVLGRAKGIAKKLAAGAGNAAEEAIEEGGSVVAGNEGANKAAKEKLVNTYKDAGKSAVMGALAAGTTTTIASVPAGLKSGVRAGQEQIAKKKEEKAIKQAGQDLDQAFSGQSEPTQTKSTDNKDSGTSTESKPVNEFVGTDYGSNTLGNINSKVGSSYSSFGDMVKDLNQDYQKAIATKNENSDEAKAFNTKRSQVKEEINKAISQIKTDKQSVDEDILTLANLSENTEISEEELNKETGKLLADLKTKHPDIAKMINSDDNQDNQTITMWNGLQLKAQTLFQQSQDMEDAVSNKLKFLENDIGKSDVKVNQTQDIDIDNLPQDKGVSKTATILSKVKRIKIKSTDEDGRLTLDLDGKEVKTTKLELEQALTQRIQEIDTGKTIPFGQEKAILKDLVKQTSNLTDMLKDSGFEPSTNMKAILQAMDNISSALGEDFTDINRQEAKVLIEQFFGAHKGNKYGKTLGLMSYLQQALQNNGILPKNYQRFLDNFLHSQTGKVIGLTGLVKSMKDLHKENPAEFKRIAKEHGFSYENPYTLSGQGTNKDGDIASFNSLDKAINHLNRTKRVYENFKALGGFLSSGKMISLVQDKPIEPTKEMSQEENEVSNFERDTRSEQDSKPTEPKSEEPVQQEKPSRKRTKQQKKQSKDVVTKSVIKAIVKSLGITQKNVSFTSGLTDGIQVSDNKINISLEYFADKPSEDLEKALRLANNQLKLNKIKDSLGTEAFSNWINAIAKLPLISSLTNENTSVESAIVELVTKMQTGQTQLSVPNKAFSKLYLDNQNSLENLVGFLQKLASSKSITAAMLKNFKPIQEDNLTISEPKEILEETLNEDSLNAEVTEEVLEDDLPYQELVGNPITEETIEEIEDTEDKEDTDEPVNDEYIADNSLEDSKGFQEPLSVTRENSYTTDVVTYLESNGAQLENPTKFAEALQELTQEELDRLLDKTTKSITNLHSNYSVGLIQFIHNKVKSWSSADAMNRSRQQLDKLSNSYNHQVLKQYGLSLLTDAEIDGSKSNKHYVLQQLSEAMFHILQTRIEESNFDELVFKNDRGYFTPTSNFKILKSNLISEMQKVFGNTSTQIYSTNEPLNMVVKSDVDTLIQYTHNRIQQSDVQDYIKKGTESNDETANEPYEYTIDGNTYSIPMWFANELTMRGISLKENPLANKSFKSRDGLIKTHYKSLITAKTFGDLKAILKDLGIPETQENLAYIGNVSKVLKDVKSHLTSVVPTLVKSKGLSNSMGLSGLLNLISINSINDGNNIVVPDELVQAMTAGIIYGIQQSKSLSSGSSRTTEDFLFDNQYSVSALDITRGTKNAVEVPVQVENLGSNKNAYVSSIGKFMMDYIGLNPNDNTNIMQGIAGSLGLEVLNHLYNKGLIKQTRVIHTDSNNRKVAHYDFVQGAWNVPFNQDNSFIKLYTDLASQSSNEITDKLFGIKQEELTNQVVYIKGEGSKHSAQNKDIASEFTTGSNSTVKEFLDVFNNQEWKLNEPYLDLQENLGELFDFATEKADLENDVMTDYSHHAKESKLNQLQRNKEKLKNVIEQGLALQADKDISEKEKRSNIRFKGFYELTSNGRLMMKSQLNMQNQKFHRESMVLVQKDENGNEIQNPLFKVSKDMLTNGFGAYALSSSDANVKLYALALAQALGVKIEKNSFKKITKQLDKALSNKVNAEMLNLVSQGLNSSVEMNQENKEIAKAFAKEYGTGAYRAIHALMSFAQLQQAKEGSEFFSDLFIEADGIGNGMHNITLQFSTKFSDSLFKTLTKTGVILTSKIAEAYEKSQAKGEDKLLFEIVAEMEGSAEIFSDDLNEEVPKDVYEDVSAEMANQMQQAFIDIRYGLDYLGTITDKELPNSVEEYILNNTQELVDDHKKVLAEQLENAKDRDEVKLIRGYLKQLGKLENAVRTITILTVSGSMKGLKATDLDKGKTLKEHGRSLITAKFSTVTKTKKGEFVSDLVAEISRALAKAGVTPATYGGKLDGITSQLIQNFQKDVTALADKALANKDKESYTQAIMAMLATNGISHEQAKSALENFDNNLLNQLVTQFNKARTYIAERIKSSAALLLNRAVDTIYGEALKTASKFIAMSTPLFSVFEQEFMDKVRNQLDTRNLEKGWARKENGKVIITDPNGYNPLTKKEFKEIFKSIQSLPVVATAYSNNEQLLDELIHTGNSNIKTKRDSKVFGSITSAYQNNVLLGHIQASIQTQNKLFMEAGASTFTNTVVSTESRSQAETQKALAAMGFSSLNVYDGNDAVAWLAGLVGDLINQNSWNVHQNYSVMESLFNMYNNSTLSHQGSVGISTDNLRRLRDIINKGNKLQTNFGLPTQGDQVNFTEKWAESLTKAKDNKVHPITKETITIDANLLTQLKIVKAAQQILSEKDAGTGEVIHIAIEDDPVDLNTLNDFLNEFEPVINQYRLAQGYPDKIVLPLSDSKVLYMASQLDSINGFDSQIAYTRAMNQLGIMTAQRHAVMAVLNQLPIKYNQYAGANRGILLNAEDQAEVLRIIKVVGENAAIKDDKDLVNHLVEKDPKFKKLYNETLEKHLKRLTLNSPAELGLINQNIKTVSDLVNNLDSDMVIGMYENSPDPMEIKSTFGKVIDVLKPVLKSMLSKEDGKLPVFTEPAEALKAYANYLNNGGTGESLKDFEHRLKNSSGIWIPNVGMYLENMYGVGYINNSDVVHELLHVALGKVLTSYSEGTLDKERTEAVNHIVETALQMFDNLSSDVEMQLALDKMIANEQSFNVNKLYTSMSAFKASLLNMKYVFGDVAQQSFTTEQLQQMQYNALQEFIAYMFTDTDALLRLHSRKAVKTSKKDADKGITKLLQHLADWFKKARNHVVKLFGLSAKDSQAKSQLISLLTDVYSLQGKTKNTKVNASVLSKTKLNTDIGDIKMNQVQNMSAEDVIDNMVNSQNNSDEHKEFLSNLLKYANENVESVLQQSQVGNLTVYNFPDEVKALQSDDLDNKAIDYINHLRSAGLQVNQAEENAFRLMYKAIEINFMGNTSRLKEQASELTTTLLNGINPNTFINGLNSYKAVFSGNKEEQLAQVLALAITNEEFKNHISSIKPNKPTQNKVAQWFKNKLNSTIDNVFIGLNTVKDIEAVGLALAKFNFRDKLTVKAQLEQDIANHKANKRDREIIKSITEATKGNKITETVGILIANSFSGKDRTNVKEGNISHYEQSFVGDMIDGVVRYNANDKGRPTALTQFMQLLTGERKDTHHIADAHSRALVNIDAVRNRIINITKKGLRDLFKNPLSDKQDKSINRMLRTSAYNLVLHPNYSVESLRHIDDSQFIDDTVNTLQQEIKKHIEANIIATDKVKEKIFNYLVWQSKGLADLQRDNEAKSANAGISNHIMPNVGAVASLAQISNILSFEPSESFSKDLYKDLSALVAVQSLAGLNQQDKQDLIEFAKTEPKALTKLAYNMRSTYLDKSNGYGLIGKDGHISDKRNPHYDIKLVNASDSQRQKELYDLGYRIKGYTSNGDIIYWTNVSLGNRFKTGMFGITEHSQGGINTADYRVIGGYQTDVSYKAEQASMASLQTQISKAMLDPNYYDSLSKKSSYNIVIDQNGGTIAYNNEVPYQLVEQLVPTQENGIDSLAHKVGRIIEEQLISAQNKNYVDLLNSKYVQDPAKQNYIKLDGAYVLKGKSNLDKRTQEKINGFYKMLPEATRKYIEEQGGLYIPISELDNIIGYHEMWISDVFTGKSFLPEPVQTALKGVFSMFGRITGTNPAKIARYTEEILREGTSLSKDYILNRSLIVPAANMISNVMHLIQWGINPLEVPKLMFEGYNLAKQYQKRLNELDSISFQLRQPNLSESQKAKLEAKRANLQNIINSSEVNPLVKAGILTSVTTLELGDDISDTDFSRFNQIRDKIGLNKMIDKTPELAKSLLVQNGSKSHKLLTEMLDYGDFVAKYALYKHLTKNKGKSTHQTLNVIREEFIDYSRNRGAMFDWLNSNGLTWFLNYKLGIQKIIYRSFRRNFLRTAAIMSSDTVLKEYDPMDLYQTVPNQFMSVGNLLPFGSYQTTPHLIDGFESHYLLRVLGLLH